jgi:two-component sensor histidine kinase
VTTTDKLSFLQGGGRSAELVRQTDWTKTPLGAPEAWPVALKTAVGMTLSSAFPALIAWGPELTIIYNDPFRPILGNKPEAMGRPLAESWVEIWDDIKPIADAALAGKATFLEDFALTIDRNGFAEEAYFTFCYSPLRDDDGNIAGLLDTVVETTQRVQAERQFRLMNSELHHRMKNMFATVTSIVSQTLRVERPLAEVRPLLLQRLGAIANAQSLLLDQQQGDLPLLQVLEMALSPHSTGQNRIHLSGPPDIQLNEKQSLSLALAVNELVTNAIKYGALSAEGGRVCVDWQGENGGGFDFQWRESGGPTVLQPARRGFGTTLMERIAPHDFGGEGELLYHPDGLYYRLSTDRLQT